MDAEASSTPLLVPDLFTVMEAARVLRVSRATAYDVVDKYCTTDDEMPCLHVAGQLRVPMVLFEEWLGFHVTVWAPVEEPVVDDVPVAQPVTAQPAPTARRRSKTSAVSPSVMTLRFRRWWNHEPVG